MGAGPKNLGAGAVSGTELLNRNDGDARYVQGSGATPSTVGRHSLATPFTTTGTHTTFQDEGLTVTVNDIAGRIFRFTAVVNAFAQGGTATGIKYQLLRDGVVLRIWTIPLEAVSTTVANSTTLEYTEPIAVTHAASVYKLQIAATTNFAVRSDGSSTMTRELMVEDITTSAYTSNVITGVVTEAKITANQTTITSTVDVTGSTVTFNALSSRTYLLTAEAYLFSTVANDAGIILIADASNTQLQSGEEFLSVVSVAARVSCSITVTGISGVVSYHLRAARGTGTGTLTMQAGATFPAFLRVEDITPKVDILPGRRLNDNGAMQVHQRVAVGGTITGVTATTYCADRYQIALSALGTWTLSVENDGPAGTAFRNSMKMLCTAADAAPANTDLAIFGYNFEGQDVQTIMKGTASALPVVVQIWVKSNKTGTYIAELFDVTNTRSCSVAFTIVSSGVWELKTLLFPADTTGVFSNDNASALGLFIWLAAGTNFTSGTLQTAWATATNANRAVGVTNLASATNQYLQVTGIQVEAGSTATPFETKSLADELAKCMRYFQRVWGQVSGGVRVCLGHMQSTTAFEGICPLPVPMRAVPVLGSSGTISTFVAGTVATVSSFALDATASVAPVSSGCVQVRLTGTISATTAGMAGSLILAGSATAYVEFSADF